MSASRGVSPLEGSHALVTQAFDSADSFAATLSKMATASTPWGTAELLDELSLAQRAGEKRFASVVQLLQGPRGERLVRFAYSTGGAARRGPVTLRERDLERLRAALEGHPELAQALGMGEA